MLDQGEIGQRIAYWRERRGMTQQLFGDRIARSKSWVEKVEAGSRTLDRLSVIENICEVLRIDMPVLIGRELPRDTDECLDTGEVEAIRAALERYDGLSSNPAEPAEKPPAVEQLRRRVDYLWLAFEAADYEVVGRALPSALLDSQRCHTALKQAESAQVLADLPDHRINRAQAR
jgi:transcriptional regulator with XRE-family HTH domain